MQQRFIIVVITTLTLNLSFVPDAEAFLEVIIGGYIANKLVDNKAKEVSRSMAVEARVEFEKAMDVLFDQKVRPLVADINGIITDRIAQVDDVARQRLEQLNSSMEGRIRQIDAAAEDRLNQINKIVNEWLEKTNKIIEERLIQVDDITKRRLEQAHSILKDTLEKLNNVINDVINNAADKFSQATAKTIDKIKTDVIQEAAARIDDLRIKSKKDINDSFIKIDQIVVTIDCSVEKARMDVERLRDDTLPKMGWWCFWCALPECYKELGLQATPKPFEYTSIYRINKCEILKTLRPETPIMRILDAYTDLMAWSARIACIQRGAGTQAQGDFSSEWFRLQRSREIWSKTQH